MIRGLLSLLWVSAQYEMIDAAGPVILKNPDGGERIQQK